MEWVFPEKAAARAGPGREWRLSKKAEYRAACFAHGGHQGDEALCAGFCPMRKEKKGKFSSLAIRS